MQTQACACTRVSVRPVLPEVTSGPGRRPIAGVLPAAGWACGVTRTLQLGCRADVKSPGSERDSLNLWTLDLRVTQRIIVRVVLIMSNYSILMMTVMMGIVIMKELSKRVVYSVTGNQFNCIYTSRIGIQKNVKIANQTLLTIGMTVFNIEKYVEKAIQSLLNQDYTNFILVISDNNSTDRTSEICMQYANTDKRINYIKQEKNIGMVCNFTNLFVDCNSKLGNFDVDRKSKNNALTFSFI